MKETVKYIEFIQKGFFRATILESQINPYRIISTGKRECVLKNNISGDKIFLKDTEMLDLAYLLMEAHFKMMLNKTVEITIKIKESQNLIEDEDNK